MQKRKATIIQPDATVRQLMDETQAYLRDELGFDGSRVSLRMYNGQKSLFIQPSKTMEMPNGKMGRAWLNPIRFDNFDHIQAGGNEGFKIMGRPVVQSGVISDQKTHVSAERYSAYDNMLDTLKSTLAAGAKGEVKPGQAWQGRSWFQKAAINKFQELTAQNRVLGHDWDSMTPLQQERELGAINVRTAKVGPGAATSKTHADSMISRFSEQHGMVRSADVGKRGESSYAATLLPGNVPTPNFRENWATGGLTQYGSKAPYKVAADAKSASRLRLEFRQGGLVKERMGATVDAGRYGQMQPMSYRFLNEGEPLTSGSAIMSDQFNRSTVMAGARTRREALPAETRLSALNPLTAGHYGPGALPLGQNMEARPIGAAGRDISDVRLSIGHGKTAVKQISQLYSEYMELPQEKRSIDLGGEKGFEKWVSSFKRFNEGNAGKIDTIQQMHQAVTGQNIPMEYGGNGRWKTALYYKEQQSFYNLGVKGPTGTKMGATRHGTLSPQLDREDIDMAFGGDVIKNELTFKTSNIAGVAHTQEPRFADAQNWLHEQMGGRRSAEDIFNMDPAQADQLFKGMEQFLPRSEDNNIIRTMLGRPTLEYGGSTKLTTNLDTINKTAQASPALAQSMYGRSRTAWNVISAIQNRGGYDITNQLGSGLAGLSSPDIDNSQRIAMIKGFLNGIEESTGEKNLDRRNLTLRDGDKSFTLLPLSQMAIDKDGPLASKYFGALSSQEIAPDDNETSPYIDQPDRGRAKMLEQYAGGLAAMDTTTLRKSAISSQQGAGGSYMYVSSPDVKPNDLHMPTHLLREMAEQMGANPDDFIKSIDENPGKYKMMGAGWPNIAQGTALGLHHNPDINQPQTSSEFQIAHRRDDDGDRGWFRAMFRQNKNGDFVNLHGAQEFMENSLDAQGGALTSLFAMGGQKKFNAYVKDNTALAGRALTARDVIHGFTDKDGNKQLGYNPNILGASDKTQNPFADAQADLKKILIDSKGEKVDKEFLGELKGRDLTPQEIAQARNRESELKKDMGMLNPQRIFEKGFDMISGAANQAFPEFGKVLRSGIKNAHVATPARLLQESIGRIYQAPLDLVDMNAELRKSLGGLQFNATEKTQMLGMFNSMTQMGKGSAHDDGRKTEYQFEPEQLGAMFADPSKPEHMRKISDSIKEWRDPKNNVSYHQMTAKLWEGQGSIVSDDSMMGRIHRTAQSFHMEQGIRSGDLIEDGKGGYIQKDGRGGIASGTVKSLRGVAEQNPELFSAFGQVMGKKDTRDLGMFVDAAVAHPVVAEALGKMGIDMSAPVGAREPVVDGRVSQEAYDTAMSYGAPSDPSALHSRDAFDNNGNPTQAAHDFAKANGTTADKLGVDADGNIKVVGGGSQANPNAAPALYEQAKARLHGIIAKSGSITDAMKAAQAARDGGGQSEFRTALNDMARAHGVAGQDAYVKAANDLGIQMESGPNGISHSYAGTINSGGSTGTPINASAPIGASGSSPAAAAGGGGSNFVPPSGIGGGGGGGGGNNYTPGSTAPPPPNRGNGNGNSSGPVNQGQGIAMGIRASVMGGLSPQMLAKIQAREIARGLSNNLFREDDALSNFGQVTKNMLQKDADGNYSIDTGSKAFMRAAESFHPTTTGMMQNINEFYQGNMGDKASRKSFKKGLLRHAVEAGKAGDDDTADTFRGIFNDVTNKSGNYKEFASGLQSKGAQSGIGYFESLMQNADFAGDDRLPKAIGALTESMKKASKYIDKVAESAGSLTTSVDDTRDLLQEGASAAKDVRRNQAAVNKIAGSNPGIKAGQHHINSVVGAIDSMTSESGIVGAEAKKNLGEGGWAEAQTKANGTGGLHKLMSGYMAFQVARSIRFGFSPFEQAAEEYRKGEGENNATLGQGGYGKNTANTASGRADQTAANFKFAMGRSFSNIKGAVPAGMSDELLGVAGTAASIAGPGLGAAMISQQIGGAMDKDSKLGGFLRDNADKIGVGVGLATGVLEAAGAMNNPQAMGRVDNAMKTGGWASAALQDPMAFVGYGMTGLRKVGLDIKKSLTQFGNATIPGVLGNFLPGLANLNENDADRATYRAQGVYQEAKGFAEFGSPDVKSMSAEQAAAFIDVGSEEGSMYRGWADQRGLSKPQGKSAMALAFKRSKGSFDDRLYGAAIDAMARGEDPNANLNMADQLSQLNGSNEVYGGNRQFSGGVSEKKLTQMTMNANLAGGAGVAQELLLSGYASSPEAIALMREGDLGKDGIMSPQAGAIERNKGAYSAAFRSMGLKDGALKNAVNGISMSASAANLDAGDAMGIIQGMAVRKGNYSPNALADYANNPINYQAEKLANQNFEMLGGDQMAEMIAGTGMNSYSEARAGIEAQSNTSEVLTPLNRRRKQQNAELYSANQQLQGLGDQEGSMTLANLMGPADSDGIYNDLQKSAGSSIASGNLEFGATIASMGIFGGDAAKGAQWATNMTPVQRNQMGQLTGVSARTQQGIAAAQSQSMAIAKMGYQGSKTESGMLMSLDNLMSSGGSFDSLQDVQLQSEASDILSASGLSKDQMETGTGNISRGAKANRISSSAYSSALQSLARRRGDYSLDGWTKNTGESIDPAREHQADANFAALGGEGMASAIADAGGMSYDSALGMLRSQASYKNQINPRDVEEMQFANITTPQMSNAMVGSGLYKTPQQAATAFAKSLGNVGSVPTSAQVGYAQQEQGMRQSMASDLMAGGMSAPAAVSSSVGVSFASYNAQGAISGVSEETQMRAGIASQANSSLNDLVRLGSLTPAQYEAKYKELQKTGNLDALKDIGSQVSAASIIRGDGVPASEMAGSPFDTTASFGGVGGGLDTKLSNMAIKAGMDPQQMRSILRASGNRKGDYSPSAGLDLMGDKFDVRQNMISNQNYDAIGGGRSRDVFSAIGMGSAFSAVENGPAVSPVVAQALASLGGGDVRMASYAMASGMASPGGGIGPMMDTSTGGKLFQSTMTGLETTVGGSQFYKAPPTAAQIGQIMAPMAAQVTGGRAGNTAYQGRLNKVMSGAVYGANMGGARGLAMESAVVSRDAAMASAGAQIASLKAGHEYSVNTEMPFRWTQQEMGFGQQFGGVVQTDYMKKKGIGPMDFGRGSFARERAGMELQIADMKAQKQQGLSRIGWQMEDLNREQGRTNVRNQWQREDFQLQGQSMAANRAMQTYNFGFQQRELGFQRQELNINRQSANEDFQYNRGMRNLQHGWQMEDADQNIRRATGFQRRQLVKERDRAQILHSKESGQDDKLKKRQDAAFDRQEETIKRQEDKLKKELEHFKVVSKIEDKQFANQKKRFEEEAKWKDEDFNIQKGRLAQEMAWAQESFDRSMAQIELRKEGMDVEEKMAAVNHELAVARFKDDEAHELRMFELNVAAAGIAAGAAQKQFEIATNQMNMAIKEEDRINAWNKMLDKTQWDKVIEFISKLIQLSNSGMNFSGSPDDRGEKNDPPPPPNHAKGGDLNEGANIAGEHGAEMLFYNMRSGRTSVLPNSASPRDSKRAPGGGNGGTQVIQVMLDSGVLVDTVIKNSPAKVRVDAKRTMWKS